MTILSIKEIFIPLENIVFSGEIKNLILDFEEVTHIDSTFIAHLLTLKKKLKTHGKQLFLTSINIKIMNIAVGGEIEQLFTVFTSPVDAFSRITPDGNIQK